ncbi:MAG: hypothetical protein J1G38_01015 [Clostridiales bacterium]|nr:hypothetical protein [Clostridiales bacterium]
MAALLATMLFVVGFPAIAEEEDGAAKTYTLESVEVVQNDGYVFSDNQKVENLRYVVTVTAVYTEVVPEPEPEGDGESEPTTAVPETIRRVLTYSEKTGDMSYKATTGETVAFAFGINEITATVTPPAGDATFGGEAVEGKLSGITIQSGSSRDKVGIWAEYIGTGELETWSPTPGTGDFAVYYLYSDGRSGKEVGDGAMTGNLYKITGNLFPNNVSDFSDFKDGDTYSVDVAIESVPESDRDPVYTTTARIPNITYRDPEYINPVLSAPDSKLAQQTAMKDVDLTGVTVALGTDMFDTRDIALSVFSKGSYTIKFYKTNADARSQTNGVDDMIVGYTACRITFTYVREGQANLSATGIFSVEIIPAVIHMPTFPTVNVIDYYDGVSLSITDLDYSNEVTTLPVIDVEVSGAGVSPSDYVVDPVELPNPIKITFKKPGLKYTIKLLLTNPTNSGNYQWGTNMQGSVVMREDSVLTYEAQVNKSTLLITSPTNSKITWEYGKYSEFIGPTVTAKVVSNPADKSSVVGSNIVFHYITTETDPNGGAYESDEDNGLPTAGYYHLLFREKTTEEFTDKVPTKVGKYQAIIVTHESQIWRSSRDYKLKNGQLVPNDGTVTSENEKAEFILEVTITPVVVDSTQLLRTTGFQYNRYTMYTKSVTLASSDSILKEDYKYVFVDDSGSRRTAAPLTIDFDYTDTKGIKSSPMSIKYAGKYVVNVTLTDDNFVFDSIPAGDTYYTTTPKPQRTPKSELTVNVTQVTIVPTVSSQDSWVYGSTSITNSAFTPSLGVGSMYAKVAGPTFYKTSSYTTSDTEVNIADSYKWGVGRYYAKFTTEYIYSSGDGQYDEQEKNSCVFNYGGTYFDITQRELDPTLADGAPTYDHSEHSVTVSGYDAIVNDDKPIKMTVTYAGLTSLPVISYDDRSNTFKVKNAGTYTVTLTVDDPNYIFKVTPPEEEEEAAPNADTVRTFTYTVNRATATLKETSKTDIYDPAKHTLDYVGDGTTAIFQSLLKNASLPGIDLPTYLNVKIDTITKQGSGDVSDVNAVGTYEFRFTIDKTFGEWYNYDLDGSLVYTLVVKPASLTAPVFIDSYTYDGATHSPYEFITEDWLKVYDTSKKNLSFTITFKDGSVSNMRDAGTYTIAIEPANNYSWETGVGTDGVVTVTFEIKQLKVILSWILESEYDGSAKTPSVTITNKVSGDDLRVVFDVESATVAGSHKFTVTSLDGTSKDNYTITGASDLSKDFVIRKRAITVPAFTQYVKDFSGANQEVTVYKEGSLLPQHMQINVSMSALFDYVLTGAYPSEWFTEAGDSVPSLTVDRSLFNLDTGKLTVREAGVYTLVLTLKADAKANYCLAEEAQYDFELSSDKAGYYTTGTINAAQINRYAATPPSFADVRAMEFTNYKATAIEDIITAYIAGLPTTPTVGYGKIVKKSEDSDEYEYKTPQDHQMGGDSDDAIGFYYVILSFEADKYNYVWKEVVPDPVKEAGGFLGTPYVYRGSASIEHYNSVKGAYTYLHYAITATQINIGVEVINDFMFGDNGEGYVDEKGVKTGDNDHRVYTDNHNEPGQSRYAFGFKILTQIDNLEIETIEYKFYKKSNRDEQISALVNGLPWHADTYVAEISIEFKQPEGYTAYQTWTNSETFTIRPLKATVRWEYNYEGAKTANPNDTISDLPFVAEAYKFTPVLTNIPVASLSNVDAEKLEKPKLTTDQSDLRNVLAEGEKHYIKVTHVDSSDYTWETDETILYATIKPETIRVVGREVTDHIYGNSLDDYDDCYVAPSSEIYGNDTQKAAELLYTRIENAEGDPVTRHLDAVVGGTYFIVPYIRVGVTGWRNYVLDVSDGYKAAFTVVKRDITVTIIKSVESVYGVDGVNLNDVSKGVFAVSDYDLPDGVLPGQVFTISTSADGGAITNRTPVGVYDFTCTLTDEAKANYVDFTAGETFIVGEFKYTVSEAALLGTDGLPKSYSHVYTAQEHKLYIFPQEKMDGVTTVDGSAVTWTFQVNGTVEGSWKPVSELSVIDVCDDTYYFKAEAANHTTYQFDIAVSITKKTLTVAMKFEIFYGEQTEWMLENCAYKTELSDLWLETGIYTVTTAFCSEADERAFYAGTLVTDGSFSYKYSSEDNKYERLTSEAGDSYPLTFVGESLKCTNYSFEGDGTVTVVPLPIVVTVTNKELFSTKYLSPLVTPEITVEVASAAVSTKGDGSLISLDGITKENAYVIKGYDPQEVGDYQFTVEATKNFTFETLTVDYKVTHADNGFTDDGYHLFSDENSTSTDEGAAPQAWTYGDREDGVNPDGYDVGGKHALTDIDTVGKEEYLVITLERNGVTVFKINVDNKDYPVAQIYDALKNEFNSTWSNRLFTVGDYHISFVMAQSKNYEGFTHDEYFTIGKAKLLVTASAPDVVYGEDAEFVVNFNGLVNNGTAGREDLSYAVGGEDNYNKVISLDSWTITNYEKGKNVGTYALTITDKKNNQALFANYELVYDEQGDVTVVERKVLVTIGDVSSHYMFIGAYEGNDFYPSYKVEDPANLDIVVTVNEAPGYYGYYNDDRPFDVRTTAWKPYTGDSSGRNVTESVGKYPIYIVFKEGDYATNYIIEFEGCHFNKKDGNAIGAAGASTINNAGTYEIKPAQIRMSVDGPYYYDESKTTYEKYKSTAEGLVYDGYAKHYFATPQFGNFKDLVPNQEELKCDAIYFSAKGDLEGAPKDIGSYRVRFSQSGANSNFEEIADSWLQFDISAKALGTGDLAQAQTYTGKDEKLEFDITLGGISIFESVKGLVADGKITVGLTAEELEVNKNNGLRTSLPNEYVIDGNKITVKVTEAGIYRLTVTLLEGGNYSFNDTMTVEYVLTVNRMKISAWAVNKTVQYGTDNDLTKYTPDSYFSGFEALYATYTDDANPRPSTTGANLQPIIAKNIAAGYFTVTFFYDGTAYSNSAVKGSTFTIDLKVDALNFEVKYLNTNAEKYDKGYKATLTVEARDIDLDILEAIKNIIKVTYHNGDPAWNSNHESMLNEEFGKALSTYLRTTPNGQKAFGSRTDLGIAALQPYIKIDGENGRNIFNVNKYPLDFIIGNANFNAMFNYNGKSYGSDDNRLEYEITKATLRVRVHAYGDTVYNEGDERLSVTYGDADTEIKYVILFDGWLGNDTSDSLSRYNATVSYTKDGKPYTPYVSHVGEVYDITVVYDDDDPLHNYAINYVTSYLDITSREIYLYKDNFVDDDPTTKRLDSRVYTEDASGTYPDYHNGIYGAEMPAKITFDGFTTSEEYAPKHDERYSTKTLKDGGKVYQEEGDAPRVVGDYTVDITLRKNGIGTDNYDYVFAGNAKTVQYAYEITQRVIDIEWQRNAIDPDEMKSGVSNRVALYQKDIMTISSFALGESEYSKDGLIIDEHNNGLTFTPTEAGTYRLTIVLIDTATHNYRWKKTEDAMFAIVFKVNSDGIAIISEYKIADWTYGSAPSTPSAKLIDTGNKEISNVSLVFEYMRVEKAGEGRKNGAIAASSLYDYIITPAFSASMPTNAGEYLMRVSFVGNRDYDPADTVYYLFVINKKQIGEVYLDEASSDTVYEETNGAISITASIVGYDAEAFSVISSDAQYTVETVSDGGAASYKFTLTANRVSAEGFKLKLRLNNSDNFVYLGSNLDGTDIIIIWKVEAADNNTVTFDDSANGLYKSTYGDSYTLTVNPRYQVGSSTVYSYILLSKAESDNNGGYTNPETDWQSGLPTHAGEYIIRVRSGSVDGNYNTAVAYHEYVIDKATLTVMASGSVVYGLFSGSVNVKPYSTFELINAEAELKYSDTISALTNEIGITIDYTVKGFSTTGYWAAGDYEFTFTATTADYYIVCVTGVFTVNKATLRVTIGNNSWSFYSKPINYSDVTIDVYGLVDEANERDLYISNIKGALDIDATSSSNVNIYTLYVDLAKFDEIFAKSNYVLEVTNGLYEIRKLPVTVVMDHGGYYYGQTPIYPSYIGVFDGEDEIKGFDLTLFTIFYGGSLVAPTDAGSYGYTVSIAADCNYELAMPVGGVFEVKKIMLDPNAVVFETVYYDGTVKAPKVIAISGGDFDEEDFDIAYEGAWDRAGVVYYIILTLKNVNNTAWIGSDGAVLRMTYTISRGTNDLVPEKEGGEPTISITNWTYGEYSASVNAPSAKTRFGAADIVYEYSADCDSWFLIIGDKPAGDYYVRAVVYGTTDYETFYSEPVKFTIWQVKLGAPVLHVISEGAGKNDTYTSEELSFSITGVDFELMNVSYNGSVRLNGNTVTAYAVAAGSYVVRISIKNANYTWADTVKVDEDGNALLEWTVKKQKVAIPTHNDETFIINGTLLKYLPNGFNSKIMSITGNRAAYGGKFTATVTLRDTDNYEWADGTTRAITFTWEVVGANTVFIVVMSVLGGLCGAAAIVALVQFIRYRKREKANAATAGASGGTGNGDTGNNESEGNDSSDKGSSDDKTESSAEGKE